LIYVKIVVPHAYAGGVEAAIKRCCAKTNDVLLGRQCLWEINKWLFLVRIIQEAHLPIHLPVLNNAFVHGVIESFELLQGNVVHMASPDIVKHIQCFPLTFGDFWISDIDRPSSFFLCFHRLSFAPQQTAWLVKHKEIGWKFI
jgi:hypothetical protein